MATAVPMSADECDGTGTRLCDWVADRTGNKTIADVVEWIVGPPLAIIVIVIVAWLLSRLATRIVSRVITRFIDDHLHVREPRRVSRANSIAGVVASVVRIAIWMLALFLVLGELGVDLAPLLAGAGVAGVALGFGAQSVVRDTLAGFFMIIEDQFGLGDWVDLGEASGTVEKVSLRVTVVRGLDGTVWHVPNGEITRVGNKTQLWSMAVLDVAVAPHSPIETVKSEVLATAIARVGEDDLVDLVIDTPQLLGVQTILPESISIRLLVKTAPGAHWGVQRQLREAIKRRLDELGIDPPLPSAQALFSRLAAGDER